MPPMSERSPALFVAGENLPVVGAVRTAHSPMAMLRGWMGVDIPDDTALHLAPCTRVHTFGVRCPLDIAHCDRHGLVLRVETMAPNRIGPRVPGTHQVWETRSPGFRNRIRSGQILTTAPHLEGEL